jgi:transcriptional regulator PpsR
VSGAIAVLNKTADGDNSLHRISAALTPETAGIALTSFADVTILLDSDGIVRSCIFGADTDLALELPPLVRRKWLETLAPDSVGKGQELQDSAVTDRLSRAREINHLGSAPNRIVALRYAAIALPGNNGTLLVGRSLQAQASLQRQLVDAQQNLERDYSRMRSVETRYRVLFQLGRTPMLIVDVASRKVMEANSACLSIFALPASRMTGRSVASLFDEHDSELLQGLLTTALNTGEAKGGILRAAVGHQHFDLSAHLFRQEGASLLLLQARPVEQANSSTGNDVIALPSLIERLPEGFVITDGDGQILEANRTFLDMAELPMPSAAIGKSLSDWLGRAAVDFGVLLGTLQDRGTIRGFTTVLRGSYGAEEAVEVSAVKIIDHAAPRIGFLIRSERQRANGEPRGVSNLPRSVEQMKELVGSVPLKELVRETTDVIERLCIEAALELTDDNRASAAEMLGLSRQSLYAKLHRFGLGDLGGGENT